MISKESSDNLTQQLERLKKEKVQFLTEITQITKIKSELESKLSILEKKLYEAEKKFSGLQGNVAQTNEFKKLFAEKEKKIQALESELTNKVRGFESVKKSLEAKTIEKDREIDQLRTKLAATSSQKDEEIRSLGKKLKDAEAYLNVKINAVNTLNDVINDFKTKLLEAGKAPQILDKIKKAIRGKVFLSEEELEEIFSEP